ncbi:MAG TPA: hypothetical protein VLI72_02060 [Methylibium sp.]|nr:hypothetical protein [Methylibium sp.]
MPRFPALHRLGPAVAIAALATSAQAAPEPWPMVGRQGIIQQVIVPLDQARSRDAYLQQIDRLCQGKETCFVNFYTNSTGAAAELPLPDAIANEATAVMRRSAKQAAELFRWSCRLAMPEPNCF